MNAGPTGSAAIQLTPVASPSADPALIASALIIAGEASFIEAGRAGSKLPLGTTSFALKFKVTIDIIGLFWVDCSFPYRPGMLL
jgi:hypothetical protein